jgi:hypothetical protein
LLPEAATDGLAVGMRSMRRDSYDGHTRQDAVEQVPIFTVVTPSIELSDRGYRGVQPERNRTRLILSHTIKLTPPLKRLLSQTVRGNRADDRARSLFDRNRLKRYLGESLHAVMFGAIHSLRMILARLRPLNYLLIPVQAIQRHDDPAVQKRWIRVDDGVLLVDLALNDVHQRSIDEATHRNELFMTDPLIRQTPSTFSS